MSDTKPWYRQPFDQKIQLLSSGYYQLWWTQPRKVKGCWMEARMRRVVDLAAAQRFAAKYNVEMPQ